MFKRNKVVMKHFVGIILLSKIVVGTTFSAPTSQILPPMFLLKMLVTLL